ncbi:MAG: DNA-directed RNA polymerase sigma-70 factor [Phycisphaerae bacterium]|nr:MAG: DNA-directed RNA polymerase sigma-70 factor [Phycisphaerae bacterium]
MVDFFPLVYDELRALAGHYFQGERRDHTLQPTALVHEAYMRLAREDRSEPKNRQQFFAIAATFMRRILVNHAKSHNRIKRGGNFSRVPLDQFPEASAPMQPSELLALDSAIGRLARIDARKASIVELRYFAGLTINEVADILDTSPATVKRDWLFAKTWLLREIKDSE